jgi:glycosyltransferase involved in cell wall biosynthesis
MQTPLIIFGDDWGRHVSSMQHLLRHLFPKYPTIWINGIGHRVPELSDAKRALQKLQKLAQPRAAEPAAPTPAPAASAQPTSYRAPDVLIHPAVLPLHHWRSVEMLNAVSLKRAIRKGLQQVGGGRPIVITGTPPSISVVGQLDEIASIYICMDDWAHIPGVSPKMLLPLERRLLDEVDVMIATARALTKLKVPKTGHVHHLPQGVNYEHFQRPRPVPADLAAFPRPWIGFAGGVGPALDLDVIHAVAAAFPEGSVLLVGPEQPNLGEIRASNVHRLGARPYAELPAYVQAFDVGMIPYVRNEWTESVDPLKLLEYLASGIPVVSTSLPEVHKYSAQVSISSDPAVFTDYVKAAVAEGKSRGLAARQALAAANTWQARAEEFERIMNEVVAAKLGTAVTPAVRSPHVVLAGG